MAQTLVELSDDVRLITRREFNAWAGAGWFDDEPVELLEGVIVRMAPEGGPHVRAVMWMNNHVARRLDPDVMVGVSHPHAASDYSQPEPDLVVVDREVVRGMTDGITDALLVVEAAVSSHRRDLVTKARIYANASVQRYLVVDLKDRRVVLHTDPVTDGYATVTVHQPDEVIEVVGISIDLAEMFAFIGE